ncbi:Tab2 family RNA-binding protein [Rubidibacter lacunae]|nr:Tab2 family RNA-binding protein [Rubidibacter lacunae]
MPWQVDLFRRPLSDDRGETLWELLVCDPSDGKVQDARAPQSQVGTAWLAARLQAMGPLPERLQVFRPQALGPIRAAAQQLGLSVEPTRRTHLLKQALRDRCASYANVEFDPLALDRPPPQPVPETLWGDRWQFAALPAGELSATLATLPIPIRNLPADLLPRTLGIAAAARIPGIAIAGGRRSRQLARWLEEAKPFAVEYLPAETAGSGGLILEAGLHDRWILSTFEDAEVTAAAQTYCDRRDVVRGLHFLLVQPDDTGKTYSGLWLLQAL